MLDAGDASRNQSRFRQFNGGLGPFSSKGIRSISLSTASEDLVSWLKGRDNTIRNVLGIAAFIYALYIPLALSVAHFHVPRPMPSEPRLQLLRFEHVEGAAFRNRPGPVTRFEDDQAAAQRSPLILYEDEKPLGPAHSLHHEVEYIGRGRYSHWKDVGILMSASDNTDPNSNGRLYWIGLPKQ